MINYTHQSPRSLMARTLPPVMKIIGAKRGLQRDLEKAAHNRAALPKALKRKHDVGTRTVGTDSIWTVSPKTGAHETTVLLVHGGAYIYGMNAGHWRIVDHLVNRLDARVMVPDYPLAPENTAAEAHAFMARVYDGLLADTGDVPVVVADSAGAGLALGFTQTLRDAGRLLPAHLILISPWLDVSMTNPDVLALEKDDPMLSVEGLRMAGEAYAESWGVTDSRVSPIYGDFSGLPPISIFIGTRDIFHGDTEKLRKRMGAEGLALNYFVYPGLFHDWPLVPNMPETRAALDQIVALIAESDVKRPPVR